MIGISATGLLYSDFAAGTEEIVLVRSDEHLVLEAEVNAAGIAQRSEDASYLIGMTIAGAGKGAQFAVTMLFSQDAVSNLGVFVEPVAPEPGPGLRAFFYTGETPVEIARNYQLALARAVAFVGDLNAPTRRDWQIAGASAGRVYMGMFLIHRYDTQ